MADQGSSRWNSNYGSDEAARRSNYDFSIKTPGPGQRQNVRGSLTLPAGKGATVGVEGDYYKPAQSAPAEGSLMLRYKKSF